MERPRRQERRTLDSSLVKLFVPRVADRMIGSGGRAIECRTGRLSPAYLEPQQLDSRRSPVVAAPQLKLRRARAHTARARRSAARAAVGSGQWARPGCRGPAERSAEHHDWRMAGRDPTTVAAGPTGRARSATQTCGTGKPGAADAPGRQLAKFRALVHLCRPARQRAHVRTYTTCTCLRKKHTERIR